MIKSTSFLALLLVPSLAFGYGGYYGNHDRCKNKKRHGDKACVGVSAAPGAQTTASAAAKPVAAPAKPGPQTGAAASVLELKGGGLLTSTTGQIQGKAVSNDSACPPGQTAVPGLNGTTRCVPGAH